MIIAVQLAFGRSWGSIDGITTATIFVCKSIFAETCFITSFRATTGATDVLRLSQFKKCFSI